jgi:hypothetical protein
MPEQVQFPGKTRYHDAAMKTAPNVSGKGPPSQAETLADLNTRCEGPNQFEKFDRAFRASLTVPKSALLKEEARIKRARARKRAKAKTTI